MHPHTAVAPEEAPDLASRRRSRNPSAVTSVRTSMRHFRWILVPAASAIGALAPNLATAQMAAPKAYIGMFKDSAVAVFDTATNNVTKSIPIPTGPQGLVVTPDGRFVYASSDGRLQSVRDRYAQRRLFHYLAAAVPSHTALPSGRCSAV